MAYWELFGAFFARFYGQWARNCAVAVGVSFRARHWDGAIYKCSQQGRPNAGSLAVILGFAKTRDHVRTEHGDGQDAAVGVVLINEPCNVFLHQ